MRCYNTCLAFVGNPPNFANITITRVITINGIAQLVPPLGTT